MAATAVEQDAHGRDAEAVGEDSDLDGQGAWAVGRKQRVWQGERQTIWGLVPLSRAAPTVSLMGALIANLVAPICRDSFVGDGNGNVEGGESVRVVD